MSERRGVLRVQPERLAVCRLEPGAPFPAWVMHESAAIWSVTRTPAETSVVCAEEDVPPAIEHVERGWRALQLAGPIPFDAIGVIASLTEPLARVGVPVFVISTFDTDLLLVREAHLPRAIEALRQEFVVETPPGWPPDTYA
jgi:uncharacterized protein